MSGLVKAKEYDWKDSNVQKLGSKEDRQTKKMAAKTEPAWQGCENLEGTKIWRIEKFEVKPWPTESYGRFFNGDSYIILHGEKDPDTEKLVFDVHFWIGKLSTQDEYGTAAYKTVELDTFLDDAAVQHREVEGFESDEFLEYFGGDIEVDDGGIESGFNKVKDPEEDFSFKKMVKHFKKINVNGKDEYHAVDMEYSKKNLHCDAGYAVIFSGDRMVQIKGPNAKLDSICPFNNWMTEQKAFYPKARLEVYDSNEEFEKDQEYQVLFPRGRRAKFQAPGEFVMKLIRVITDKSEPEFKVVASGGESLDPTLLDPTDVFLLETPDRCIVWIGDKASSGEKQNALCYAQTYLRKCGQNPICGISCMRDKNGKLPKSFSKAIGQQHKGKAKCVKGNRK